MAKREDERRGQVINLFSKRKHELAGEILDSETNSLYQCILFLELFSMEAFRVDELLRHSDECDAHYYDLLAEKSKLLQKIDEEKERIKIMGVDEDFDTTEFTDGKHPEWECEVLEGSFNEKDRESSD